MSVPMQKDSAVDTDNPDHSPSLRRRPLWTLLTSWEVYLILAVAAFLRLYRIGAAEFDSDQADIFSMAHNALSHGYLVATSNVASIHIFNPPGIVYLLMIPAALSSNPFWGGVFIALLAIVSVLLTYVFTRRYYGRLAATLAASLYATAPLAIFYSRFMWNQNLLLFFVPLLMWFLFRGVVARKSNWLFPSVILAALLVQFHASSIVLVVSLVIALLLAPRRTVHWYDLALSIVGLLVLYLPYVLWLKRTDYHDIHVLLSSSNGHSVIDADALLFYLKLITPFSTTFSSNLSYLYRYHTAFAWVEPVMTVVLVGGVVWALARFLFSHSAVRRNNVILTVVSSCWHWWQDLRASPMRSGLCILLSWQIISLLYLTRHSIVLQQHYFIVFMPGPFIFIGIFFSKLVEWVSWRTMWQSIVRWGIVGICVLLIVFECIASLGFVVDSTTGRYVDSTLTGSYYNTLGSMRNAMAQAEQLAAQQHLNHIYVGTDQATRTAFRYLGQIEKTPTTVIDAGCLIVPGANNGSAVLLLSPRSSQLNTALKVDHATLIGTIPHPGGPPYRLLITHPLPTAQSSADNYAQDLQFAGTNTVGSGDNARTTARWTMMDSAQSDYHTSYNYLFKRSIVGNNASASQHLCSTDSTRAGDQLLADVGLASQKSSTIQTQVSTTLPVVLSYNLMGVFHTQFSTFKMHTTPTKMLKTKAGAAAITIAGT